MSVAININVEDTEQRRLLFVDLIAELPDDLTRKATIERLEVYIDDTIEQCNQFETQLDSSDLEDELDQANDLILELKDEIKELKTELEDK